MAKKRHAVQQSRAIVMTAPRPAAPIIRVNVPRQQTEKHHKKHHRRKGGGGDNNSLMLTLAGGAVMGFIDKEGTSIPTLPVVGRAGTVAIAAWALGKYMGVGLARKLAPGIGAIALYELVKTGKVDGSSVVGEDYVAGAI
jgi:hypothetical protein